MRNRCGSAWKEPKHLTKWAGRIATACWTLALIGQILMIDAKLCGYAFGSWWLVLAPTWIPLALIALTIGGMLALNRRES